ncbi:RES domain-containing protein [Bradyrhizobium sp. USDA 4538]|nr:RES domain-containing protein [Bradyrhizobium sp. USDA 4538]
MGGGKLIAWRLDPARYASTWDSGEGAFLAGGRWNSIGVRVVYCSLDPATAILEVAVHKGFKTLDTAPHVLTAHHVIDVSDVHIVRPADVPNANWLLPGIPGAGQQAFGDALLAKHRAVSNHSWNLRPDQGERRVPVAHSGSVRTRYASSSSTI